MKNTRFKRLLTLVLAVMMITTAMPINLLAETGATGTQDNKYLDDDYSITYNDKIIRKADYINKVNNLPIEPKKTENAKEFVKNPDMPKLYTVHSDFKVQRGDDLVVSYQPYIATAGEAISKDEKDKINKEVKFPNLDGYTSATPDRKADITYDFIKKRATKNNNDEKVEYKGHFDYIYTPITSTVKIKHVFQDIDDFNKYTNPDGTITQGDTIIEADGTKKQASEAEIKEHERITTQHGVTGTSLTIQPLSDNQIKGYVPEGLNITTQVPENPDNFVIELRYNLAHYNIKYDTAGGTPLPTRTVFYMQGIPKLNNEDIPTKVGGEFQGWKPSVDLKGTLNGIERTFKANEIIAVGTGQAIKNLDANLIMPAEDVTFTAVWKDKEKADYAVQFWAEKADHADGASLQDKYEYMGTRVYKDKDTGLRPDLDKEPVNGLKFPDLDQARLAKIWGGARFNRGRDLYLNKFYVYNQDLTHEENKDKKEPNKTKAVSATGKTVYNIYYDRQVYDLYFTKSNAQPEKNTIYPEIWGYDKAKGEAVMMGGPGNPYHYKARFNEIMYKWPNDAKQTKGFTPGYQSFGWGPNYERPNWPVHLDTPPYRLNADEFLDMENYTSWGGYVKHIDKGDGTTIDLDPLDFKTLSFGIKQDNPSIPHHMDFWMDGFKKDETIIRYDLVRTKADTAGLGYGHKYPKVTGFTPYDYNPRAAWPAIAEGSEENGRVNEDEINELNDERDEITPNNSGSYYNNFGTKLTIGQLDFIAHFFSDSDEFGDVKKGGQEFTENGYLQFHYKRNKYPLRFNYDPSIIRDDSYFNSNNSIETFYEFPLKALSPDLVDDGAKKEDKEYYKDNPENLLDKAQLLYVLGLYDLLEVDKNKLTALNASQQKLYKEGKLDETTYKNILLKVKVKVKVKNKITGKEDEVEIETYKVKRPNNLSEQKVFKGWALDPAGLKLIWQNPGEKMPFHPVNLYAKWDEPDYKWKVSFDPDGGVLENINEEKLTQKRKTIQEGDIGQIVENTYAKKGYSDPSLTEAANEAIAKDDKDKGYQVFTVIQRQKLVEPKKPTKKGYDFMGWEIIHYKKNAKGDYTNEQDTSYRDTYKVPELYSFGNDVVSPIHLKAIWVKSNVVDIKSYHHFLDKDYKENTAADRETQILRDRRVGSYLAAVGSRQNADRILVPKDEWDKLEEKNTTELKDSMTYKQYMKLDKEHPRVNSYSQQIRIGAEKVQDPNKDPVTEPSLIDNPLNVFHFYYRPFRHREYKVNYLDERGRKEVEKFINKSKEEYERIKNEQYSSDEQKAKAYKELLEKNSAAFKAIREKYAIIDQEAVKNGKRHFDARNYRPIAGWVLNDKPQQQLFFDINEDTNAFYGINETGLDEINFFYKDVRVVETGKDDPVPDGYVRVTFKAADGGVFNTKHKNPVEKQEGEPNYQEFITEEKSEIYYDVIKGLKSDLIPVPKNPIEEGKKEADKYYITPDNGKKFIKWDEQQLLNDNTVIEKDYIFTAQYDWSDLHASSKGLVKTEAFNDPKNTWTNSFAPTIDELKAQIVKTDANGNEVALPADATVTIVDDAGNDLTQDAIYKKVKEMSALDTNELVRTVVFKAKVTFTGNQADKTLDIPVKIYKNVYEALTNGDMPKVLKDATAPGGDLENVTGDYVKVTVAPTGNLKNKDNKIYYVNPNAWVNIKEVEIQSDEASGTGFMKWTADKTNQNETSGKFDFTKRHKFTDEETVITPNFSDDVKEQIGLDKPDVPGDFVKVIVEKTDKAELKPDEQQTQTFWVNPTKEVTIPVSKPNGKTIDPSGTNPQRIAYMFEKWTDDKGLGPWTDTIKAQFTETVTNITANYKQADNIIKYDPEEPEKRPDGYVRVKFDADEGLTLSNVKYYYVKKNSGVKLLDLTYPGYDPKIGYEFEKWDPADEVIGDSDITVTAKANKLDKVIPDDGDPNTKPDGYKEVTFVIKTGDETKGSITSVAKFYVKPNEYVKIDPPATNANTGFEFGSWEKNTTIPTVYDKDTTITGSFNELDAVIPKTNPNGSENEQPAGYKTVTFVIEGQGGKIEDGEVKVYYVNPAKEVTVPQPKTSADTGYEFEKWDPDTVTTAKKYTEDTTVTGNFKELNNIIPSKNPVTNQKNAKPEGYVTVTFDKGDHGSSIKGETVYYVNPNASKTIGDREIVKPTVTPDTGHAFSSWDKGDATPIIGDITVTAQYKDFDNVIPDDGNPNTKPAGYIEVTFDTTGKGTIKGSNNETQKIVFVKPKTAVALEGYEPEVEAKPGYKFSGWNVNLSKATIYNNGDKIIAQYNSLNDIKKEADPNYVRVEFKTDETKGTLQGDTVLWVAPNKEVTIPAPIVTPNAGHTFTGWDNDLKVTLTKSQEPYVITAQYDNAKNIISEKDTSGNNNDKPKGYVTVTFRADDNGKLEGNKEVITYFVNPDAGVMIVDKATDNTKQIEVPKINPDANYVFDKWFESIDKTNSIKTDLEYVARFKKKRVTLTYNIGAGTEGRAPISVSVEHGTEVYLATSEGFKREYSVFGGWEIDGQKYKVGDGIELTKDSTANAVWVGVQNIIPYDPVKDPMTRPDGYVRVTFEAEDGLSLTEQKAYYVRKNIDIKLRSLKENTADFGYPAYNEKTGYKFNDWDQNLDTLIEDRDIVVKAKATKLGNVIPEKDNNNQVNKKPDGYKEVTFVIKTGDDSKGSITGVAKFYVNPNEYVTITPPTTKANTGYVFGAWDQDTNIPTVYKDAVYKDGATITGSFNKLEDVITKTKHNESEKPANYVTVTFEIDPTTGGQIVDGETTVYYVKPNTDVTVPQPKTIAETGYKFEKWDQDTTTTKQYTDDITVKGNFKKLDDIIPSTEPTTGNKNAKPGGYITVTFDKGQNGKDITGKTVYYVNPNAGKTIGNLSKPTVKPETGYKANGWDKADNEPISGNLDIVVKAQYDALDDVILKKTDDGSEKPDGYITVTFDTTNKGRIKGTSMITKKVLFVNPNKAIKLEDKAPGVVPKAGYTFARWDVSIDQEIKYKDRTTITALYNEPGDISTTEVYGYVKVEFKEGKHGSLQGKTEYWIRPGAQVNLPAPTVNPNVGWKQDKTNPWDKSLTVRANENDPTYEITATYEELADLIPQVNKDGSDIPKGYFKVIFKGEHGTLVEPTIYYAKPNKEIWLLESGFTDTIVKDENADIGYTSKDGSWNTGNTVTITEDNTTLTYTFAPLKDAIEKTDEKTKKPKGYVIVTLKPTEKAKENTDKIYFVNSTRPVTIPYFEPTGKVETINGNKYAYVFNTWTSTRGVFGYWPNRSIQGRFTQDTDIEARYTKTSDLPPIAKTGVITPVGVKPEAKDLIKNVYDENNPTNKDNLPKGTTFEYVTEPDVSKVGDIIAKVKVKYPNGNTVTVEVPIKVVDSVIPQEGTEKPNNVPNDFVKVTFDPIDAKGTLEGASIYWVDPKKEVVIPVKNAVGNSYNVFAGWKIGDQNYDPKVAKKFEEDTRVTASYTDSDNIIPFDPKAEPPKARPEGYFKVSFDAQVGLKLRESKAYYIKKNAKDSEGKPLTLKAIKDAGYPACDSANGYQFSKWDKADTTVIGTEDIVVTALAKAITSKPDDKPSYPEVIYRDKIVEKEKIVEKIVKVGENDEMQKEIRYMQGFNGKFRPYDGLRRCEAAQILANALKADGYRYDANYALSYSDVGNVWYTDAIRVVTQAGVFQGYSDGTFKPEGKITRAEWVATLRRFQDIKEASGNTMMLRNGHWATAEVEAAYEAGWLGVYQDGTAKFDADKPITRQEVAYVSNRAFRRVLDKVYLKRSVNTLLTYKDINPSMPLYEDILCASNTLLTDNRYYKANTVVMDNLTFNIVTDYLRIQQKKFQYNVIR